MASRPISLRRLLLREGLLIVTVAGLGLTFGAWWGTRRLMEDQAQAQAEEGLNQVARRLEGSFEEAKRTGDLLVGLGQQDRALGPLGTKDAERQLLAHLQSRPALCNITLVDTEGRASAANVPEPGAPNHWLTRGGALLRRWSARGDLLSELPDPATPKDWRARPWYHLATETEGGWTEPYPFLGGVGFGLTYAVPIRDAQHRLLGAAGIDLLLGDLGPWLREGQPTPGTQVSVLDAAGRLLVPPTQEEGHVRALRPTPLDAPGYPLVQDARRALSRASSATWMHVRSGGRDYLAQRRALRVPNGPTWQVLMAIPEEDLLLHPRRVAAAAVALSLAALLLLAWRLRRAARKLEAPLIELASQGARLLDGKPTALPATQIAELLEVARCMRIAAHAFHEREALESQLRQAQRLELVGTLAAGVAHDLGNVLSAVGASLELAQDARVTPEKRAQALERAFQALRRARGFIRALLTLGRPAEQTLASLDLNQPVENAVRLLEPLLGGHIALRTEWAATPLQVMADPLEIEQVVLNLGVNARDAMPQGGILVVRTGRGSDGRPFLEVSDTGTGIPEALKAKLFTAFVTTKGPDKGTGLGLAMVHGIAKAHAAELGVESEAGRGTRFTLRFPSP